MGKTVVSCGTFKLSDNPFVNRERTVIRCQNYIDEHQIDLSLKKDANGDIFLTRNGIRAGEFFCKDGESYRTVYYSVVPLHSFTTIHFHDKNFCDTLREKTQDVGEWDATTMNHQPNELMSIRIKDGIEDSRVHLTFIDEEFPQKWDEFYRAHENDLWATFHNRKTCKNLGNLFRKYGIVPPALRIFDCERFLIYEKESLHNCKELTYEKAAKSLGHPKHNERNIEENAKFVANVLLERWDGSDDKPYISTADFSESTVRDKALKEAAVTSGKPIEQLTDKRGYSFEQLLECPKESRFAGTYVAFTLTLKMKRPEAQKIVEALGGVPTGGRSKMVTHLVIGKPKEGQETTEKLEHAEQNDGIIVLTEEEFYRLIEET